MSKLNTILSGVAGEYFVAAELSRRGYIASITLRNTRGVDVLASDENAKKSIGIQVKTNQGKNRSWLMDKKSEEYYDANLFYVFVNLNEGEAPDYFIVPSKIVADYIKKSHSDWLSKPGKKGQQRKDTSMRKFEDTEGKFLGKWKNLGL